MHADSHHVGGYTAGTSAAQRVLMLRESQRLARCRAQEHAAFHRLMMHNRPKELSVGERVSARHKRARSREWHRADERSVRRATRVASPPRHPAVGVQHANHRPTGDWEDEQRMQWMQEEMSKLRPERAVVDWQGADALEARNHRPRWADPFSRRPAEAKCDRPESRSVFEHASRLRLIAERDGCASPGCSYGPGWGNMPETSYAASRPGSVGTVPRAPPLAAASSSRFPAAAASSLAAAASSSRFPAAAASSLAAAASSSFSLAAAAPCARASLVPAFPYWTPTEQPRTFQLNAFEEEDVAASFASTVV